MHQKNFYCGIDKTQNKMRFPGTALCFLLIIGGGTFVGLAIALNCGNVINQIREGSGLSYLGQINWTVPVSTGPSGWTLTLFFDQDFNGVGVN